MTPIRSFNNNHYANLQIDDHVTTNIKRAEDKKVLFKVPFSASFKGTKTNGVSLKNGAGPLTKPPPCFLQPKARNKQNVLPEAFNQSPKIYEGLSKEKFYNQGKNQNY